MHIHFAVVFFNIWENGKTWAMVKSKSDRWHFYGVDNYFLNIHYVFQDFLANFRFTNLRA